MNNDGYPFGSKELVPADAEFIAVLDDPVGITAAKLIPAAGDYAGQKAAFAFIQAEAGKVRFKCDGTDPVALTDGHLVTDGSTRNLYGYHALSNLRMVREDGAENPVVQVTLCWAGPVRQ